MSAELLRDLERGHPLVVKIDTITDVCGTLTARPQGYYTPDRGGAVWEYARLEPDTRGLMIAAYPRVYDGSVWQRLQVTPATRALKIQIRNADHGAIHTTASLADDDHPGYPWMLGRASGQSILGGTGASEMLLLGGTAHATKGPVRLVAGSWFDVAEITAPGTPAGGFGSIYAKSSDSKLYFKNDAGTEFDLTTAGTVMSVTATSPVLSTGGATPVISLAGLTTLGTGNYVAGVNSGATAWEYKNILGTASEIDVAHGVGTITIGLVDPVGVTKGGTGLATVAINTLLYASAGDTLATVAAAASSVLVTSAGSVPSLATDIPTAVTIGAAYIYRAGGTDVAVADGGTGLSSGTSGGILGYTASGTVASSVLLTANAIVLGAGAGATPTPLASLGTTTAVLHGAAAGPPTWSAVVEGDVTLADVTTLDVTSTKHGLAPKSPGDATKFLRGDATPVWAAPTATIDINGMTAADLALADELPEYNIAAGANRKVTATKLGGFLAIGVSELRLTLTSGLGVTTADVTAAGTLYLTPHIGNRIRLWDGTRWNERQTAEVSLALTLTNAKPYDIFAYDNAGTVTLEVLVWTNDTTRATALTTQNGAVVKSGDATRLYLGSLYASGANTTEDSASKRYLWNMYNRVLRHLSRVDTTDTWSYGSAAWRQANAAAANQVNYIVGLDQDIVQAMVLGAFYTSSFAEVGVGVDATNANGAQLVQVAHSDGNTRCIAASYRGHPGIGRHYLAWIEYAGSGTPTFIGDLGGTYGPCQTGINAEVWA